MLSEEIGSYQLLNITANYLLNGNLYFSNLYYQKSTGFGNTNFNE